MTTTTSVLATLTLLTFGAGTALAQTGAPPRAGAPATPTAQVPPATPTAPAEPLPAAPSEDPAANPIADSEAPADQAQDPSMDVSATAEVEPVAEPVADSASEALALETPWTFGVAPRLGFTIPTSSLGAMVLGGLEIDYVLPVLAGKLVIALDGSLTRPGHSGTAADPRVGGPADYDLDVTEFKLSLDLVYRLFGSERRLVPFGGIGPVLHMLKTKETTNLAPGTNTAQDSELGVELLAGVDYRLGPGYAVGEARFVYTNLDHLFTGDSNAGNVMISAGYRLVF